MDTLVLTNSPEDSSAVCACVSALRQGKLVVVPTETVYGIAALVSNADAVAELYRCKGRPQNRPFALAAPNFHAVETFAPNPPHLARNVARKLWPGSVTLILDANDPASRIRTLPPESRLAIAPQGAVGFRCPQNAFLLDLLTALGEPIALTSANLSGGPDSLDVETAREALGDRVPLFIDGGPAKIGKPSTVVLVKKNELNFLRYGALSEETIRAAAIRTILFICSGNTVRSACAEGLAKRALAERTATSIDRLETVGFRVLSAGLDAFPGDEAAHSIVDILQSEYDVSLRNFRSRSASHYLVDEADLIYVMTREQLDRTTRLFPGIEGKTQQLRTDGYDLEAPDANATEICRALVRQIDVMIRARLDDIMGK